jgi:hypothetical protein
MNLYALSRLAYCGSDGYQVQCHKEVLWKRPEGYLSILQSIDNTLTELRGKWPDSQKTRREAVDPLLASRLKLLKAKLEGIRSHRHITLSRLKLVGNVLRNLVSLSIFRQQKEIKFEKLTRQRTLNLEISNEEERRETQRAQKDLEIMLETRKQTTMAVIGIIFLPGALISVSTPKESIQHVMNGSVTSLRSQSSARHSSISKRVTLRG